MISDLRTLSQLSEDRSPEAREVFEDAVHELTHDVLERYVATLADLMRGNAERDAGKALLLAHRIFRAREVSPFKERETQTASRLADGTTTYLTRPWTAYVPRGPYGGTQAVQTTYDANRSTMRIAGDRAERFAVALRWLDEIVRGGRWAPPTHPFAIVRDGKVVARGQDLAIVTKYAKKAGGAVLIAKERIGTGGMWAPAVFHILFDDGGTVSIPFGSFHFMEDWLANKQRVRTSWLFGAPSVTIDGPTRFAG